MVPPNSLATIIINYAKVIGQILPEHQPLCNDQAPLRDWLHLAKEPITWQKHIDNYFESCAS
jgi:hypothetical protein